MSKLPQAPHQIQNKFGNYNFAALIFSLLSYWISLDELDKRVQRQYSNGDCGYFNVWRMLRKVCHLHFSKKCWKECQEFEKTVAVVFIDETLISHQKIKINGKMSSNTKNIFILTEHGTGKRKN